MHADAKFRRSRCWSQLTFCCGQRVNASTLSCLRAAKLAGKTRLGDFSRAIALPVRHVTHESRLKDAFRNEFDTENTINLYRICNINVFSTFRNATRNLSSKTAIIIGKPSEYRETLGRYETHKWRTIIHELYESVTSQIYNINTTSIYDTQYLRT